MTTRPPSHADVRLNPAPSLLASDVWCDLPGFTLLQVEGADAAAFLQGQLSNDVRRVSERRWQYTSYNSPKGRMLAVMVLFASAGGYRLVLPADIAESVRKRLGMFVLRSKVSIADLGPTHSCIGVAGPTAAAVAVAASGGAPQPGEARVEDDSAVLGLAPDRLLAVVPQVEAPALRARLGDHAQEAPESTWRWLSIRAGVPLVTRETQDAFVAQTANLDALGGLSFDKGCYTGQEIIARTQYLGRLKERLHGFHSDAQAVAPGTRLYSEVFGDQACGTVVNAVAAPAGGLDLLAVVQTAAVERGDVRLGSVDGPPLQSFALPYPLPEPSAPPRRKL